MFWSARVLRGFGDGQIVSFLFCHSEWTLVMSTCSRDIPDYFCFIFGLNREIPRLRST